MFFCWDPATVFVTGKFQQHVNILRVWHSLRFVYVGPKSNMKPTKCQQHPTNVNILSTSVVGILSFMRSRLFASCLPKKLCPLHKLAKHNLKTKMLPLSNPQQDRKQTPVGIHRLEHGQKRRTPLRNCHRLGLEVGCVPIVGLYCLAAFSEATCLSIAS